MKKVFIVILLLLFGGFCYFYFFYNKESKIPMVEVEDNIVSISKYYTYSTYLNMEGSLELTDINFEDVVLTIYNGEFKDYEINYDVSGTNLTFNLSDELNRGLFLDGIDRGTYYLFIKITYKNYENEAEKIVKYYKINNETDYKDTTYYTMSKVNNEVKINSDNTYPTMMLNIVENTKKDVVDFIIDPGHGGMDGGAEAFGSCERDFTYNISLAIGNKLKEAGYSVDYTRDELDKNDRLEEYNEHGRAVISSEKHAKYVLSIHFNSSEASYVKGLEVYAPININYDFVRNLVENITTQTGLTISPRKTYKLEDGIYGHNFTQSDIENSLANYVKKGYEPYNITTNSNYYFMIRETGGIVTGAYVDDKNEKVGYNPYYNSNTGAEAYVLELGYITNSDDFEVIKNKHEEYAKAITDAVVASFEKK